MTTLPDNFWAKTTTTDCIIWTGAVNDKGYPCFAIDRVSQLAHRLAYVEAHGEIPDGMTIDHTCRVRNCVNVNHLELVTRGENTRRRFKVHGGLDIGGACLNGHSIRSADDVYTNLKGRRECQECRRQQQVRARTARVPAAESPAAIRSWAADNGYVVGVRGRVPAEVRDAYYESIRRSA